MLGEHVHLIHTMPADEECGLGHRSNESSWRQPACDLTYDIGNGEKNYLVLTRARDLAVSGHRLQGYLTHSLTRVTDVDTPVSRSEISCTPQMW
jgi:hypothetical protein